MHDSTMEMLIDGDPEAPFWMVWNPRGNAPVVRHASEKQARDEAERLARTNPGHRFHVLENKGCCEFQAVHWTKPSEEWVPF